jgi:transglutaminase-like putative cysteine protease
VPLRQRKEVQEVLRAKRRIVPIAITVFWIVMMALFLYREYGGPRVTVPSGGVEYFTPRDQWMGIYLNEDRRVGHLRLQTEEESRESLPGHRMRLNASLETKLFGVVAGMDISGEAWTAASGERAQFRFSLMASDTEMGLRGAVADGRFQGEMDVGGETLPLDFPVDSELLLGGGMGLTSPNMPKLEVGESADMDAFDPMSMKLSRATVSCVGEESLSIGGETVPTRIYETTLGSVTSRAWVDATEEVVQASTPFGFTLRKIEPEILLEPVVADEGSDLIQGLAIRPQGAAVRVNLDRLVVRVSGIAAEEFPHDPPWQLRDGDRLTIARPSLPNGVEGVSDEPFDPEPYLESDAFVTADHPKIVAQAREIVNGEAEAWRQTELLHDWLFEEIDKVPVLSVPNALDVLRTRAGDCNEHTVLFTALARSLKIPTRIAIGLVYSDTIEGFGYHAWPEVHVDGGWHPLDPTLGQLRADATHIKLFNGSIDAWIQLAAFIGQIQLDVIKAE